MTDNRTRNSVLVHGGFVDGSGWEGVYQTGDVVPEKAEFMANSQVPWGLEALNGANTKAQIA